MASEKELALANEVFEKLCNMLDNDSIKYNKSEENQTVDMIFTGEDDFAVRLFIQVDNEMQTVRAVSPLPIEIKEDKLMDLVVATSIASFSLADGCFDVDMRHRGIVFRISSCFSESEIGEGVFKYLISGALSCVERYCDKFVMLNNGMIEVSAFLE